MEMRYCRSIFIGIVFFISSCTDIIVEDISSFTINIIGPGDSMITNQSEQFFLWEEVLSASRYRFSISKPNFDSPELIVLDTILNSPGLKHRLDYGKFEWRIRAENSGYQTKYFTREIKIDSLQ